MSVLIRFLVNLTTKWDLCLGRPVVNVQIYTNSQLQPVPLGVPGELHVGGPGQPTAISTVLNWTAEKFISNPFSDNPAARIHKTGDLASYFQSGI